jgi:hypothetical protein
MKLLVTGSRDYADREFVVEVMKHLWLHKPADDRLTIIHGCDGGVSLIVHPIALENFDLKIDLIALPAMFSIYGEQAEEIRNRQMVDDADQCFAFLGDALPSSPHRVNVNQIMAMCDERQIPVIIF